MAWHRRSRRGPLTLRLWVSVALLTLPGWRVPGIPILTSSGVLCPNGHGRKPIEYGRSARCGECPLGWFQWAPCPYGTGRIASTNGTTWQCGGPQPHRFKARMCPDGRFVGLPREDGLWQCTSREGHAFEAAPNRCTDCHFGFPVRYAGGARWDCPACGWWRDSGGG